MFPRKARNLVATRTTAYRANSDRFEIQALNSK